MSRPQRRTTVQASIGGRLQQYFHSHEQSLRTSLERILAHPFSNGLTIMVIAVALALPGALWVLAQDVDRVTGDWHTGASLTLFLKNTIKPDTAGKLGERLKKQYPQIAAIEIRDPAEALAEFQQLSGFEGKLEALIDNPLPVVVIVRLDPAHSGPDDAAEIGNALGALPEVEVSQLDLAWLQRLAALMEIVRRAILALGILLGLGVLLVIGNTIRLEIESRRDEIEITKLVGGTSAFVRRPFLYTGLWYGVLGAALAWLLVAVTVWALDPPVRRLAGLYNSDFGLSGMAPSTGVMLIIGGLALGVTGAFVATSQHLRRIEPR